MCRIREKDPSFFKYWRPPLECLFGFWHDFFQDGSYLMQLLSCFFGSSLDVFVNCGWFRFWHDGPPDLCLVRMPVFCAQRALVVFYLLPGASGRDKSTLLDRLRVQYP